MGIVEDQLRNVAREAFSSYSAASTDGLVTLICWCLAKQEKLRPTMMQVSASLAALHTRTTQESV